VDIAAKAGSTGDEEPPPGASCHDLDVRPMLARGEEPFQAIMRAVDRLADGQVLLLRSPFDPRPLHAVLGRKGFLRRTRELAPDDFETAYWRGGSGEAGARPGREEAAPPGGIPRVAHVLDVRGMLPPEPLERTLAALGTLAAGDALVQINERVPVFLLPELDERGYSYLIGEDERGTLVTIWRKAVR